MNYISVSFILFLSIVFILYYLFGIIKNKEGKPIIPQWTILLIGSLVFYGFSNLFYLVYIGISMIVSYITGYFVQYKVFNRKGPKRKLRIYPKYIEDNTDRKCFEKLLTIFAIAFNVGILAILKYYNFFATSVNSVFGTSIITQNFIIPLGISFYTLSLISYNVDVYKREFYAEHNIFKFMVFVTYFPKIIQGPISSYEKVEVGELFQEHQFLDNEYNKHFLRIAIGAMKVVVIAGVLSFYVNSIFNSYLEIQSYILILGTLLFSIELYCAISGYMDISMGISCLFGVKLEENFNTPYMSLSIKEFCKKWYITLGKWMKKYIYIPLGGNRVSNIRWVFNIFIVMLVTGLWLGANYTFIFFGLYLGILLVLGKFIKSLTIKLNINEKSIFYKSLMVIITFALVNFGLIFFKSNSLNTSFEYIKRMCSFKGGTYDLLNSVNMPSKFLTLALFSVGALVVYKLLYPKYSITISNSTSLLKVSKVLIFIITCTIFILCIYLTMYMNSIGGGELSFIYFDL